MFWIMNDQLLTMTIRLSCTGLRTSYIDPRDEECPQTARERVRHSFVKATIEVYIEDV